MAVEALIFTDEHLVVGWWPLSIVEWVIASFDGRLGMANFRIERGYPTGEFRRLKLVE